MSEKDVVGKVEELMKALDQVKKYKALAHLLVDFVIILLLSVVALFTLGLVFNFSYLTGNTSSYFVYPNMSLVTRAVGIVYSNALPALAIIATGVLVGVFWVDHKLKRIKLEEWKNTLNEGFAGAVKLLQELNWNNVFDDIRASKIAYTLYAAIKVVGYWILLTTALALPYSIGLNVIHVNANFYLLAFISLAVIAAVSRKDLQKKYRQVTSLDQLLWELRWFNSEFSSAEFKT
jgi:hypothetical protein